METKIISYNPSREYELGECVKLYCHKADFDFANLTIVEINAEGQPVGDVYFRSLKVARELAKDTENIVILINADRVQLEKLALFQGLMTLPNVGLISSFVLWNVADKYRELCSRNKLNPDPTTHALFELEQLGVEVAELRKEFYKLYDATNTVEAKVYNSWHDRARRAGFAGTDRKVIADVTGWIPARANFFSGHFLPGIFVEACGSLFDLHCNLVLEAKEAIADLAKKTNRSVFVLVGNNDIFPEEMKKNGITWQTLNKETAHSATLEFVISQGSEYELLLIYGILVKELCSISTLPLESE